MAGQVGLQVRADGDGSDTSRHSAVCGAPRIGLSSAGQVPAATASISPRIEIIASQNASTSVRLSLSVGSTINVPATGKLIVGA